MYIEINNTRLFYIKKGKGEPIILVHGNGESHKIFKDIIEELSQSYTVYALDMRGQGESDKIDKLRYEDMAQDIIEFIALLNIENPYYFGFSDGGNVGLIASYKSPTIFKKMMIAGANTSPSAIKKSWLMFFKIIYFFSRSKILKVLFNEPYITPQQLEQISIKTIVVMGQHDCIYEENGWFIVKNMQNAEFIVLKKENHSSYVFNNKKLLKLIQEHLLNEEF